jgi:hypothetical protein
MKLMMTGKAIVRYINEDESDDEPDFITEAKLYLKDEKSLILIFPMVFPKVSIDELVKIFLWDPFQMRMKVPWDEYAIKIDENVIILKLNLYRYSESYPTSYQVYARLQGEIPAEIPESDLFELS